MKPIFENEKELAKFIEEIIWRLMPPPIFYSDKNNLMINIINESKYKGYIKKPDFEKAKDLFYNTPVVGRSLVADGYIEALEKEIERLLK